MKFSEYFLYTRKRSDRTIIEMEWILQVVNFPQFEQIQADKRIKRWAYIKEAGKYLRVILLEDKETIHNAFFDRSFDPKKISS